MKTFIFFGLLLRNERVLKFFKFSIFFFWLRKKWRALEELKVGVLGPRLVV